MNYLPAIILMAALVPVLLWILFGSITPTKPIGPIGQYDKEYAVFEDCIKNYSSLAFCGGIVARIKE